MDFVVYFRNFYSLQKNNTFAKCSGGNTRLYRTSDYSGRHIGDRKRNARLRMASKTSRSKKRVSKNKASNVLPHKYYNIKFLLGTNFFYFFLLITNALSIYCVRNKNALVS